MLDFFFVEFKNKALCIICEQTVNVLKEYNLKHHYGMHKAEYDQYIRKTREDKLKNLTVAMKKR